jgi:hypothetical protein
MWQTLFWLGGFVVADFYSVWAAGIGARALKERQADIVGWACLARVLVAVLALWFFLFALIWRVVQLAGLVESNPWWLQWPPK